MLRYLKNIDTQIMGRKKFHAFRRTVGTGMLRGALSPAQSDISILSSTKIFY